MQAYRVAILAAFFCLGTTASAISDDVTLTARDGSLALDGTLLSFDGEFYRVETEFGELTLDGSGVVCSGPGCPDLTAFVARLRVAGSASVGTALFPVLIETFAVRNGYGVRRLVQSDTAFTYEFRETDSDTLVGAFTFSLSTSDEGFADLIADETDLVISRREIARDEAVLARQAGRGDLTEPGRSRILALDGIVPIVAVQNPAQSLTMSEMRKIVRGKLVDWSDLGQEGGPIELHVLDPSSGLFQAFLRKVGGLNDLSLPPNTVIHQNDAALADAVANDPFAFGLAAFSDIGNAQDLSLRGPCGALVSADIMSLKSEDYPLTAPIFLYSPVRRLPRLARDFLAYANSPAAQPVIRRAGFVDQFPQAIPLAAQGDRLAGAIVRAGQEVSLSDLKSLVAAMTGKVRLSLSFRFEDGSTILDAQSRSNVALLAEAMERGVFDDRRLTFAGFSDGAGDAATNRRLSQRRAAVVRAAVRKAARTLDPTRITIDTAAFGEMLPMACDDSDWGRRINRRVEVWLD